MGRGRKGEEEGGSEVMVVALISLGSGSVTGRRGVGVAW